MYNLYSGKFSQWLLKSRRIVHYKNKKIKPWPRSFPDGYLQRILPLFYRLFCAVWMSLNKCSDWPSVIIGLHLKLFNQLSRCRTSGKMSSDLNMIKYNCGVTLGLFQWVRSVWTDFWNSPPGQVWGVDHLKQVVNGELKDCFVQMHHACLNLHPKEGQNKCQSLTCTCAVCFRVGGFKGAILLDDLFRLH